MVSPKKIHTTWKFRVKFYSVGLLGLSLSLGDSISGDPKWADSEEAGDESSYIQVCSKGQVIWILKVIVAQSCLTLCNPMDCSLPGSSVHGILQAGLLEWVAISFSRGFVKRKISYVKRFSDVLCMERVHVKRQAGWSWTWNQDSWEKYQ